MRISVVVPTCERVVQLASCLATLAPGVQTLVGSDYEVIVSDDGRSAHPKESLAEQFPFVTWIEGPRRGPAANRNCGAAVATGELLAFIDDDCRADANWLESYALAASRSEAQVFEGRTYADRPRRSLAEGSPLNETGGNLWSCNFAIRCDAYLRLGGFDERFPYPTMEDVDFHARCRSLGYAIEFVADASVCHPLKAEGDWAAKMRNRRSLLFYMEKHPEAAHFRSVRFWAGSAFWTILRGIIYDGVAYRGKGLWHPLQVLAFQLSMLGNALLRRLLPGRRRKDQGASLLGGRR